MSDHGTQITDKSIAKLDRKIKAVYSEAEIEIQEKMNKFLEKFKVKHSIMSQKLKSGEITKNDYDKWMKGQVFQREQWQSKKKEILSVLTNSNKVATQIINQESLHVFGENANYMSYLLDTAGHVNFNFSLYDSQSVSRLLKKDRKLLPEWKVNEPKDYAWNNKKVNRQITQGIIQGESLDKIAKRLSSNLSSQNFSHMRTFARTAMTGAQNAGREESLKNAKTLGINVMKMWMATLDGRTRDSHRHLDGEKIPVGDAWHHYKFSNGLRYPADPEGPAHEVYNCRCTMVGELEDFPDEFKRYDNINGHPIDNITYDEWYKQKLAEKKEKEVLAKYGSLEEAQKKVDILEDKINALGADKKFENIWYDQTVTYADWEEKKDSIQAKREYFEEKLENARNTLAEWYAREYDGLTEVSARRLVKELESGKELSEIWNNNAWLRRRLDNNPKFGFDVYEHYHSSLYSNRITKFKGKLIDLDEFEKNGAKFFKLHKEYAEAKKVVHEIKMASMPTTGVFPKEVYSTARKDKAIWAKSPKEADDVLRAEAGRVWNSATINERDAIYEYTQSYSKFNEPLRGYEYGTSRFLGVGNTDLNAGYKNNGDYLNAMTDYVNKSRLEKDQWFQRGCRYDGMDKFFDCDMDLLKYGTQEQLEAELLGKPVTEYGFMSMGSSKGRGFDNMDVMLNVYCPEGTKAAYVEPFSAFGQGDGRSWDGVSKQTSFGHELETILQQGTEFRVIKVERTSSTLYFDIEVIDQSHQQRWVK